MYLALGIATVVYVAVALGVFGTLTVDQVIDSGATALAVAARPARPSRLPAHERHRAVRDRRRDQRRTVSRRGLVRAAGSTGQFPPVLARPFAIPRPPTLLFVPLVRDRARRRVRPERDPFDRSAIALAVFAMVTIAHLRVREVTGANIGVLVLALATVAIALFAFVFTELIRARVDARAARDPAPQRRSRPRLDTGARFEQRWQGGMTRTPAA